MGLLDPTPPPYDPLAWVKRPLAERGRMVCEAWAMQGYGTPPGVFAAYALKIALYVGGWMALLRRRARRSADPRRSRRGGCTRVAFQKAIVWSMLFEVLGLGLRQRTAHRPLLPARRGLALLPAARHDEAPALCPGLPLLGGRTRGDARRPAVRWPCSSAGVRALVAPAPAFEHFLPLVVLLPLLGVTDKTLFLAARGEHYWVTLVCFAFAGNWIAGAKAVQLALWFWAGFSKLNHHFPTVVCVMTSNGPLHALPVAAPAHVPRLPARPAALGARDDHGARGHGARARRAARVPARRPWARSPWSPSC